MQEQRTRAAPRVQVNDSAVAGWPRASRRLVQDMVRNYDLPHEITGTMAVWYNNGPWRRSVVHRAGVAHQFPIPHHDLVAQTIYYRVSPEKSAELIAFNGSLTVDRTRGELTAYCQSEEMNFLLLNLANDIVLGKRSVEEARRTCASSAAALRMNWPIPYGRALQYSTDFESEDSTFTTTDPDHSLVALPGWRGK